MLDFLQVTTRINKSGGVEVFPKFKIYPQSKDLMVRGGDFYAVWVEELGLWSMDEHICLELIDKELEAYANQHYSNGPRPQILYMWDSTTCMVDSFHKFCQRQLRDNFKMLDEELIFSNTPTTRENYASRRLSYPLEPGDISAYDKIIGTLYTPDERHKLEWAIGAIVSGDSKWLQKFMVLYGAAGTGKSTILNIIQQLFEGYYCVFDAKALGQAGNSFSLEPFKMNPLVAIQHDGDLSRIEDNTRLNSLVSHERMTVNEKHKGQYENDFKCFLFLGTNRPVKITDAKSGLLRRLIDVSPSGNKLKTKEYRELTKKVKFELGAIAHHCLDVYLDDPHYYDDYVPLSMMGASNDFYNFVYDSYLLFKKDNSTTLKVAWEMYKAYEEDAKITYGLNKRAFKEELKNYFHNFSEKYDDGNGKVSYSYYYDFKIEIFEDGIKTRGSKEEDETEPLTTIEFAEQESIFDKEYSDCPAQYASKNGIPTTPWADVDKHLSDIDTSQVHYVKVPQNHIVIDFDITDENGEKSFELNIEEASKWPPTYAELSKSGGGIHLHYIYTGDVTQLSRIYNSKVEVKTFTGGSSLRRKLSKCNNLPIATISSGLPLKEGGKKVKDFDGIKDQRILKNLIEKHMRKEIMGHTKPSIDMIKKILDEAYESGMEYDLSEYQSDMYAFAMGSTNKSKICMKIVDEMKFQSDNVSLSEYNEDDEKYNKIVFFDCEVFPNLFLVNWKMAGEGNPVVRMINPTPYEIEELIKYKLIGFNNRNYDNHMLHGALMGYSNEELYKLSKRLINKDKSIALQARFSVAYKYSYTDVYDFSSAMNRQSLKKWEIQLGITHHELGLDWDEPVPEELWHKVAEYCDDDVIATEAVFNHLKGDWTARQILAELAGEGSTVNDTTNNLTSAVLFGNVSKPNLTYTDLATGEQYDIHGNLIPEDERVDNGVINSFPGYEYKWVDEKKRYCNIYRDTDIGFGGYIRSNPGIHGNVALLDVASLHPTSMIMMNYFGEYTQRYLDLKEARVFIKHEDYESAKKLMDGQLAEYLDDPSTAKDLSNALKTALNSAYGLTSASFTNSMKHPMNKNNIVALRGALFMKTLQDEVEAKGYEIVAIKTDSIKIADADKDIIDFCMEFGKQYGYEFEFEAFYDKMCQINDADYVARYKNPEYCEENFGYIPGDNKKHAGEWTATGKRFQIPYVFKTMFSHEDIEFDDLTNVFSVQGALYLDYNECLPDITEYEKELSKLETKYKKGLINDTTFESSSVDLIEKIEEGHDYHFIGRVGQFCPIKPNSGGAILVTKQGEKYNSANGAKGYRWLEAELVRDNCEDCIDYSYFKNMVDEAVDLISEHGDYEWFVSEDEYVSFPMPKPGMKRLDDIVDEGPEELPWD